MRCETEDQGKLCGLPVALEEPGNSISLACARERTEEQMRRAARNGQGKSDHKTFQQMRQTRARTSHASDRILIHQPELQPYPSKERRWWIGSAKSLPPAVMYSDEKSCSNRRDRYHLALKPGLKVEGFMPTTYKRVHHKYQILLKS